MEKTNLLLLANYVLLFPGAESCNERIEDDLSWIDKKTLLKMRILKLAKNGDAKTEFVQLKATADESTQGYALVDKTYKDGNVTNIHRHVFFFPDVKVKQGDLISVRTGKGPNGSTYQKLTADDGITPLHRFWWGSNAPIWNDKDDDAAVLIRYSKVNSSGTSLSGLRRLKN